MHIQSGLILSGFSKRLFLAFENKAPALIQEKDDRVALKLYMLKQKSHSVQSQIMKTCGFFLRVTMPKMEF